MFTIWKIRFADDTCGYTNLIFTTREKAQAYLDAEIKDNRKFISEHIGEDEVTFVPCSYSLWDETLPCDVSPLDGRRHDVDLYSWFGCVVEVDCDPVYKPYTPIHRDPDAELTNCTVTTGEDGGKIYSF